jgi:hypothetical protein
MIMKKVFICSPYRGEVEKNTKIAREFGRLAAKCDYVPVIPHLVFPQFLDDNDPEERILGITLGAELLKVCDMMWVVGDRVTKGMQFEIETAKKLKLPVRLYDKKANRIYPDTLAVDDRVNDEFLTALKGANLV